MTHSGTYRTEVIEEKTENFPQVMDTPGWIYFLKNELIKKGNQNVT